MKLITQRDLIRDVANRWEKQYPEKGDLPRLAILRRLRALDVETASAQQVADIIGNDSWTSQSCSECGEDHADAVVQVGQELNYESRTAWLCLPCVRKAAALAGGA